MTQPNPLSKGTSSSDPPTTPDAVLSPTVHPASTSITSPRVFSTEELFPGGRKEVWIQHGDALYRLRITSADKLVLTK